MEEKEHIHKNGAVHFILAHSYLTLLFVIILGVLFDTFLNDKIFSNNIYKYIGLFMMIISSIIVLWAQKTSFDYKNEKLKNNFDSQFEQGPYKYLRHPTYFSLFIMTIGFGLIINSFFSVIFTIVAYVIVKFFFLKKEEKILEQKYGEAYGKYKKKVKDWL